mmetsp:Transcript_13252/g.22065  ORF Transcript_13252/g.22065 Transcript_13252/m.22065 type:complete len:394 (-) Transcript_13252:538-1719(-)
MVLVALGEDNGDKCDGDCGGGDDDDDDDEHRVNGAAAATAHKNKPKAADDDGDESSSSSSEDDSDSDDDDENNNTKKKKKQPAPATASTSNNLLNLLDDSEDYSQGGGATTNNPSSVDILSGLNFEDNFISAGGGESKGMSGFLGGGGAGGGGGLNKKQLHAAVRPSRVGSNGILLKESLGEGLQVRFSFVRQDSIYSKSMLVCELEFVSRNEVRDLHMSNVQATGVDIRPFDRIPVLHANQTNTAKMHIDFKGSERKLKFDICTTDRKYPVALTPTPGDLLRSNLVSVAEFESTRKKLTGMQESRFKISNYASTNKVATAVSSCVDVAVLGEADSSPGTFRMAATLRHDKEQQVLIVVEESKSGGGMDVTVNCDDMLFLGRLEDFLKKKLKK